MKTLSIRSSVAIFAGAVFLAVLLAGLLLVSHGVQARPPGKLEARITTLAKHSLLVGGKDLKNPLPTTPENTAEGRRDFSHYCFACHGLDGHNTGVPFADAMSPPVPPLASREVQTYTDGQLYWVIKNGLWPSGMPASRGILTDEEIWSIVIYIRNLPRAGSLGEPPAYSGEGCTSAAEQMPPLHSAQQLSQRVGGRNRGFKLGTFCGLVTAEIFSDWSVQYCSALQSTILGLGCQILEQNWFSLSMGKHPMKEPIACGRASPFTANFEFPTDEREVS